MDIYHVWCKLKHPAGLISMLFLLSAHTSAQQTITFPSLDTLPVTADIYLAHGSDAPLIVLFHQAGWSRGEYGEIAPKLNVLGFNCLAVDLRSGGSVLGVTNKTAAAASQVGAPTGYTDALPDVIASLRYARAELHASQVLAWGSSYSAALVIKVAGDEPELVDGVLSFAPGEYFESAGKPVDWIQTAAKKIRTPTFITSARHEKPAWVSIFEAIPVEFRVSYLPATSGNHGSRALWGKFADSDGYWGAVRAFLDDHFAR